ncbi:diacylglycerol kinase family lipid kinase [Pseudogracilibacillus sp. SE30717A]|uniref:diacylglycerol/lipid kinase family protein n=1 Tax=Pseudogracilibacillus sp. SE30717A TaxID=3098293 RepID=UPI00300E324B
MNIIIVNPRAGNGNAKKIHLRLMKLAEYKKLQPICYYTDYPGHAEEIAANLNSGCINSLIVIGGDGTMHEVINGLNNPQIPISFIPGGSGNDFTRGSLLPNKPTVILNNILHNHTTKNYWLGTYTLSNSMAREFINCIGFGFDAEVTKRANHSPFKRMFNKLKLGTVVYSIALVSALFTYKPSVITIKTEKEIQTFTRCFLMTINNQPYFGGGMKINPTADNNEEEFSIMVIDSISKWKVLALFITVFKGKHIDFKEVTILKAKRIEVISNCPLPYQVDGEVGTALNCKIAKKPFPIKVKGA